MNKQGAAVIGLGHSPVSRFNDVPLGLLAVAAAQSALDAAKVRTDQVNGVVSATGAAFRTDAPMYDGTHFVSSEFLHGTLGLDARWEGRSTGMVSQSFIDAVVAIESGLVDYVLVSRSLYSSRGGYGHTAGSHASGLDQFIAPYGVFYPSSYGRMWHRYQDMYGRGTREEMASFVIRSRANGLGWAHNFWSQAGGKELSFEQYMNARLVSSPLCLFDCDIPVQASAAFVLTSAERARDHCDRPAYVLGVSSPPSSESDFTRTLDGEIVAGRRVASELWRNSGLSIGDIDTANLYDGFSFITIMWLEAFGFCARGEGFAFLGDDAFPLNTSGGSIGAGRTHGVAHLMESALQVMGRADGRQVSEADVALSAVGPLLHGAAVLFGREPR
jgi:acetyl-CoA acetyltransferase